MGKIIPMARRVHYRNQTQDPMTPEAEMPESPEPAPKPRSTALKTFLMTTGGVLLGLVVGDVYRKITRNKGPKNDGDDGDFPGSSGMVGAIPGAPSIMPMSMPYPMPMLPMQMPMMPNYGHERSSSLSDADRLELERLRTEKAKVDVLDEQMKAWEEGEID